MGFMPMESTSTCLPPVWLSVPTVRCSMRELLILGKTLPCQPHRSAGHFRKMPSLSEEGARSSLGRSANGGECRPQPGHPWMQRKPPSRDETTIHGTRTGSATIQRTNPFCSMTQGFDGRYLSGSLSHEATTSMTVFGWVTGGGTLRLFGTYAYNIGPNHTSHQRDDSGIPIL